MGIGKYADVSFGRLLGGRLIKFSLGKLEYVLRKMLSDAKSCWQIRLLGISRNLDEGAVEGVEEVAGALLQLRGPVVVVEGRWAVGPRHPLLSGVEGVVQ